MKQVKAFVTAHFNGNHFAFVYDTASGRKHRYTVLQWRVGQQTKVIGRELTLDYARRMVEAKKAQVPSSLRTAKKSVTLRRSW